MRKYDDFKPFIKGSNVLSMYTNISSSFDGKGFKKYNNEFTILQYI